MKNLDEIERNKQKVHIGKYNDSFEKADEWIKQFLHECRKIDDKYKERIAFKVE